MNKKEIPAMVNKKNLIPWAISVGIFFIILLIWALFGKQGIERIEDYFERGSQPRTAIKIQSQIVAHQEFFSGSAVRIKPAVVSIAWASGDGNLHPYGSGVIINSQGYIITCSRNVSETKDIKIVRFVNEHNYIYDASIVSVFPASGLTIIRIVNREPLTANRMNFPFAKLGDSNSVQMGDWCLTIGNPIGLKPMITLGIINSLNQTKTIDGITYYNLLKNTCKGGEGFIGGPLINKWGEVIGIVIDNGYAVPSNQVEMILAALGIP